MKRECHSFIQLGVLCWMNPQVVLKSTCKNMELEGPVCLMPHIWKTARWKHSYMSILISVQELMLSRHGQLGKGLCRHFLWLHSMSRCKSLSMRLHPRGHIHHGSVLNYFCSIFGFTINSFTIKLDLLGTITWYIVISKCTSEVALVSMTIIFRNQLFFIWFLVS